ncbi:alpha/beta-hydrolase [Piedraia hortae CBS 480.64]|uniref:Alpha/beta-hydrolase n=1 Tax=Piedraia hortae CBS 480.64 TaxID=1314780 RepID=A0A6A7C6M2_9PEZI|nr:alpha/beta-hydrolase [Piedraia hortae CBS 480.64]
MIDHVLGRPSVQLRKYQVFCVVLVWSLYLAKSNPHGPRGFRRLSRYLSRRLTTWRAIVIFSLSLYVGRNFGRLVGLESPEPLANLYTRSYFRATWVTTALDAGFWTAMRMRPQWLRDICSLIFSVYYLVCAEQADEMVRKVRGGLTLEHLRVSWNKPTTRYLAAATSALRPRWMRVRPRQLRIPRPPGSSYREPIEAWLYFDGTLKHLSEHTNLILDIPGGGFVAMDPRCHDDKLMAWAAKTGLPVLALNYKKAPEYPYPYALNECYDAYHTVISSRGRCLGLGGTQVPRIVVSGDSAGGNLAVGLILMLLQESPHTSYHPGSRSHQMALPLPETLVCIYPALDMNISNWMTDEQMELIKAPERRRANRAIIRRKTDDYHRLTPDSRQNSDDEDESPNPPTKKGNKGNKGNKTRTRLAMSSKISYFNDRIITPEMLRAMIIMYIGPFNRPDFATDFLLSPLLAPESLLARFPKTYLLTGERDPLVDDTVIFAGRLRQAKHIAWKERQELGLIPPEEVFDESRFVEMHLIPGISHGFVQMVALYADAWKYIFQAARWMKDGVGGRDALRGEDYFSLPVGSAGPLEIRIVKSRRGSTASGSGVVTPVAGRSGSRRRASTTAATRVRKPTVGMSGRRKRPSLVRLASTEDLMGRRMGGLTGALYPTTPNVVEF